MGGDCKPGLSACGHSCVNLGSDPDNCGACGRTCAAFEQCLVGVCLDDDAPTVQGRPVDGGLILPDGGLLLPDGAVVDPDGSGGSSGDGQGGASGAGGNGDVCSEPFDTPQYCGDCDTHCQNPRPYCAPTVDSFECVVACTNDLFLCNDRCVDVTTDIDHCGACNRRCPTAICRDSTCVGEVAGHVVSMCMSLESYRADAPQNSMLANAIFLAEGDALRVGGYAEYATTRGIGGVQRAVDEADAKNAREIQFSVLSSAASVPTDLAADNYDVFLVYDQALAPSGSLATLGRAWRDPLAAFTARGGVVIVLGSATGTAEMDRFIAESALLSDLTGQTSVTGELLYNRAPSDAVGLNVFGEFRALRSSCSFSTTTAPSAGTTFVVTDALASSGEQGNPSVIHRVTNPGG